MSKSHLVRMPDLSALEIPAKQCLIRLKDGTIFSQLLQQHRELADREGGACLGDYVLIRAAGKNGEGRDLHIQLGGKQFPDFERVLLGRAAGETFRAEICGEDTEIAVASVRQVVDLPLTDQAIAALRLPGTETLADYRRQYIRTHGSEIAEKLFHAIQENLLNQAVRLMDVLVDQEELEQFHQQQRAMIRAINGGELEQRLMDAYGGETPEDSDRRFFSDNRRAFLIGLWGKALAERDGRTMTEAEQAQMLGYYQAIYGKSKKDVLAEGLMEEVSRPFYIQYGIREVLNYYKSLVRFSAEGIEPQAL